MANLKETRARIGTVKTTQQITKAMKLVAASKLRRAQDRITTMRPYADKLYEMLGNIMAGIDVSEIDLNFSEEREVKKVLVVLVTSDKGLCGSYNSTLIKQARKVMFEDYYQHTQDGSLDLMVIGKKGHDAYKKFSMDINTEFKDLMGNLVFEEASKAAQYAMTSFLEGHYDMVRVIYAEFKNAATQIYQNEQFLPIKPLENEQSETNADYIFEPEKEKLIKELIPKILKTQFYRYLLDANASEQGARMVAMDNATENAEELLKELKLEYNRERQAAITKEILEIVGGAAALEEG